MNVLPRRKFFRSGDVRDGSVRGGSVRGGRTFAAEVLPPRTMVLGKIFLADIFFQRTTSPVRGGVRVHLPGSARSPPVSAGRSLDFQRSSLEFFFGGSAAEGLPPTQ